MARDMARDMVALMAQLGFARFKVLAHDRAARVAHRMLADQPLQVLWGQNGVIASCFDPLKESRRVAVTVAGQPLACGHYVAEVAPVALLEARLPLLLKP